MFSGVPPIADIARRGWHGRKVPHFRISRPSQLLISSHPMTVHRLLDHICGLEETCGGNTEIERLRPLRINYKVERCWLLDGQITCPFAIENLCQVPSSLTQHFLNVRPERDKSARIGKFSVNVHIWQPMFQREINN